jgi:hypothetical protein
LLTNPVVGGALLIQSTKQHQRGSAKCPLFIPLIHERSIPALDHYSAMSAQVVLQCLD